MAGSGTRTTPIFDSSTSDNPYFLTDMFFGPHTDIADRRQDRIRPVVVSSGENLRTTDLNYGGSSTSYPAVSAGTNGENGCNAPSNVNTENILKGAAENVEAIGKSLGLSQPCIQTAKTHLGTATPVNNSWLNALTGGVDKTSLDTAMENAGCGQFSTSLTNVFNQMSSLKCQFTNMTVQTDAQTLSNASVTVKIIQPSAENITYIRAIARDYDEQIQYHELHRPQPSEYAGFSLELVNVFLSSWERGKTELIRSKEHFLSENPVIATLQGSTINAESVATSKITTMTEMNASQQTSIIRDIKNTATETAVQKIQSSVGLGALGDNAREYVQQQVSNVTETRENQIVNMLNQNKLRAVNTSSVEVQITGRVSGSTINAMAKSDVDVKVQTALKSAIAIGEQVASQIVTALGIEHSLINRSDGIDNVAQGILNAQSERAKLRKEESESWWGGFFTIFAVIAIILIVVGGYFGYQYLQSRTGGKTMGYGRR